MDSTPPRTDADSTDRVSMIPAPLGIARDGRGVLTCNTKPVADLLRDAKIGSPAYVYDLDAIGDAARALVDALGENGLCAYAIKANGAPPIVRRILAEGCGIDVVSGGELRLALGCGASPAKIVYSGVAKRDDELDLAIGTGIKSIHAESVEEIVRIAARTRALGKKVDLALRINPSVEVDTHAHIATGHDEAKFGIAREDLGRALDALRSAPALRLVGLSAHVGSQLMSTTPYLACVGILCDLGKSVNGSGFSLQYLDPGGGYGIAYGYEESPIAPPEFVHAARAELDRRGFESLGMVIEPGRAIVAAHGVLVSSVIQPKRSGERRWLLIDAGMNDLIRPALYQARHRIEPLVVDASLTSRTWRVAGPVCESSDDFGEYSLPDPPPEQVAIRDIGAYGRSMASTYNVRPIATEVFVAGGAIVAVRPGRSPQEQVDADLADAKR